MLWRRGKSYSQDLRERVFAAADESEPVGRIATMLRVSVSYVSKVLSRRRLTGQTQARPQRCHVVPKLSGLYPAIEAQVSRRPDATIAELCAWLLETHKVSASAGLMNKTLAVLDLTFKNVWPAPSASVFGDPSEQSASTYPVSGLRPDQDGDPRAPVLIKLPASSAIF
jgi:transposase